MTTSGLRSQWFSALEPPEKMFRSEKGVFQGPSLSLGHFGQQIPESPVFQPQNGVSTSSLSPFIVDFNNIDI